jgi:hypothetical protein
MGAKENLVTVLDGGMSAKIPFSIYDFFVDDMESDKWKALFDQGLLVTNAAITVKATEKGVQAHDEIIHKNGDFYHIFRKETPFGTVQKVTKKS